MSDSSGCSSPSPSHNRPIWTRGRRATEEEGEGAAIAQFLESGSKQFLVDPMKWEDDDIALRAAAANARMPWDALTAKEFATFPEVTSGQASKNAYLWIRNKILQLWNADTLVQLTAEMVIRELPPPFDSKFKPTLRLCPTIVFQVTAIWS
ncbi:SWIRM domain containing protein [Aphelenchoides avenae]|nr:SWIRM domain containing protein [Aphelenchus avenae]